MIDVGYFNKNFENFYNCSLINLKRELRGVRQHLERFIE